MQKNRKANVKIIDAILQSVDNGMFLEKILNDFRPQQKPFNQSPVTKVSFYISIYLDGVVHRVQHFGDSANASAVLAKSMQKAEKLLGFPQHFRSATVEVYMGGALRSNGLVISVSGFKSEAKCEYLAWVILNTIERRLNEFGLTLGDVRFKDIDVNTYITKERDRLASFNFAK